MFHLTFSLPNQKEYNQPFDCTGNQVAQGTEQSGWGMDNDSKEMNRKSMKEINIKKAIMTNV